MNRLPAHHGQMNHLLLQSRPVSKGNANCKFPNGTPSGRQKRLFPRLQPPVPLTETFDPSHSEGVVRAHEYARHLRAVLARMNNDKDSEISAYEEFRDLCAKRADYVKQLHKSYRRGGEAEHEALARCRYHWANAELAALRAQHQLKEKS